MTDRKGRRAAQGWVFFDGECEVCQSLVRRFRATLEKRGFGLAPLQDPRVAVLLGLRANELLQEMRVLTPSAEVLGGAQAIAFLAGKIWWAWPLHAVSRLPGMPSLLGAGYRWFAQRRHCVSCGVSPDVKGAAPARGEGRTQMTGWLMGGRRGAGCGRGPVSCQASQPGKRAR